MELCWKVQGFSREKKDFFDRYLYLDTSTLPPVEKHRVEICAEHQSQRGPYNSKIPQIVPREKAYREFVRDPRAWKDMEGLRCGELL